MTDSADKFDVDAWMSKPLFAVLSLEGLNLLLPQEDVHSVEPILDVEPATNQRTAASWVDQAQERWPIYCLSPELDTMRDLPVERRVCVLLDRDEVGFGLAVEQVTALQQGQLRFFSLPICMRTPGSPVRAMACQDEAVLCVTTAIDLADYLARGDSLPTMALVSEGSTGSG